MKPVIQFSFFVLRIAIFFAVMTLPTFAQTDTAVAPAGLSPGTTEVVKLSQSNLGDDVVLAYIKNSREVFDLKPDAILYLKQTGISQPVISAMLKHDGDLRTQTLPNRNVPAPTIPPGVLPVVSAGPAPQPAYQVPPPPIENQPSIPVGQTPPASRMEGVPVPPGSGYVWTSGYWAWSGRGWIWRPGVWVARPHPRAVWVSGYWSRQPTGYVWISGHWR